MFLTKQLFLLILCLFYNSVDLKFFFFFLFHMIFNYTEKFIVLINKWILKKYIGYT